MYRYRNIPLLIVLLGFFSILAACGGDTIVPDKLQANADAFLLGNVVKVKIISLADKQYVTDPISGNRQ